MPLDLEAELTKNTRNLAIWYRGEVIERMTALEKCMDGYIAYYFTNKDEGKAQELLLYVFGDNRISLEGKRQVFQKIAETHDSDWYNSYISIRKAESKKQKNTLNKDLVFVIEQRNIFAHLVVNIEDEALLSNRVGFIRFKDVGKTFWYSKDAFLSITALIEEITNFLIARIK